MSRRAESSSKKLAHYGTTNYSGLIVNRERASNGIAKGTALVPLRGLPPSAALRIYSHGINSLDNS